MKILIIRFSSFGDVLQALSIAGRLNEGFADAEIHWVTRAEFVPLIESHPAVQKVWNLPRKARLSDVLRLGRELKKQNYTHIYDAHNNLRSHILGFQLNGFLGWRRWFAKRRFLRRSIYRWKRFLLFRFHCNLFPRPFPGQFALLEPLKKWGLDAKFPPVPQLFLNGREAHEKVSRELPAQFEKFVALAPSAAFPLKRWPLEHWAQLIRLCPDTHFVLLGGPEDKFLQELTAVAPDRVINLAGRLSLLESAHVVALSDVLVSNDTGLMHVAEQIGKPCLALMGPAPFGFPGRPATRIFEIDLKCRPCSKHGQGPCVNVEFQKCMRDIQPSAVASALRSLLHARMDAPISLS